MKEGSSSGIMGWLTRNRKNILITLGVIIVVCLIWLPEVYSFWKFISIKPQEFAELGLLISQNPLGAYIPLEFIEALDGLNKYATIKLYYWAEALVTSAEIFGYWQPIYFFGFIIGAYWVTTAIIPHGIVTYYVTLVESSISGYWGVGLTIIPFFLAVGLNLQQILIGICLFSGIFILWKMRERYGTMATVSGAGLILLAIIIFIYNNMFLLKSIMIVLIGMCLMVLFYKKQNKFLSVTTLAITLSPLIIYLIYQLIDKTITLGVSTF